jgi:hypothetical protein
LDDAPTGGSLRSPGVGINTHGAAHNLGEKIEGQNQFVVEM